MPSPIVTLLTDFGTTDHYVASMKGVALATNPSLNLVDVTHDILPQDVLGGAFVLGSVWRDFPKGTIHLAVVDPGVGTDRNALLIEGRGYIFLVPDNGLISFVLPNDKTEQLPFAVYQSSLPNGFRAYSLDDTSYWHFPVSQTFHGRDIFASVAGHISTGVNPAEVGKLVETINRLAVPIPEWHNEHLCGHLLHIDRFGNVITNISQDTPQISEGIWEVELGDEKVDRFVANYGVGEGLVAITGSHGYLEIAMINGDAARALGVKVGDSIKLVRQE